MNIEKKHPNPTGNSAGKRLPLKEKLAFGSGGMLDNIGNHAVKNLAQPIYNIELGLNPGWIGMAIMGMRIWDAITDPFMGSISDNARTRFGRRRPFIFAGSLGCALVFPLIWFVPTGLSEVGIFSYFLLVSILFYTAFTVFSVPFHGLGYEATSDYDERTRIMAFRASFMAVSGVLLQWIYPMVQSDFFSDTLTGMRIIGIGVGVLFLLSGILPAVFVKERQWDMTKNDTRERMTLKSAFAETVRNRPFLILLGMVVLMITGLQMVNGLGLYVLIYYVYEGDKLAGSVLMGWTGTAYAGLSLITFPLIVWLSRKIGKKSTLQVLLWVSLAGTLTKWFTYTPDSPYLVLFTALLLVPGTAGYWLIVQSMIADCCDWDEERTGRRREGMYGAFFSWIQKLGISISYGLSGWILVWIGFDSELEGGQSEGTLTLLRFLFMAVPSVAIAMALILSTRFPIDRAVAQKLRAVLDARKAACD